MSKEFYTLEEIIKLDAIHRMNKTMKQYGIEGVEDKVKEIYSQMPKLRDYLLDIIYNLWRKK